MTRPTINSISAGYKARRFKLVQSSGNFTQICPANPSRWSIIFVSRFPSTAFITPFPGDLDCPGIALSPGLEERFDFPKHPVIVGLAWYVTTFDPIVPPSVYECWEETPVGTS